MPGKEAVVEVETNGVVPEPVTKELPKPSAELKGKKDEDLGAQNPTQTVADSTEPKPQDAEITSSEQKADAQECPSDETDKVEPSDSVNGSEAKEDETSAVSPAEDIEAAKGKSKPDESAAESQVEGSEVVKSVEDSPKDVSKVDVKGVEAKAAESPVDSKSSEVPADLLVAVEGEEAKTSEAAAKSLPSDNEKIVVEKDSSPKASADVSGSDEAKNPTAPLDSTVIIKENEGSSADSSTEKTPENPSGSETVTDENTTGNPSSSKDKTVEKTSGNPSDSETKTIEKPGSSSLAVEPDVETQIAELKKKGVALYVGRDYCAAADMFGKILEMAAPVYGEMSEKLAETYYMYGTSMFEYGKDQNDVLGEKVKEKDEESEDEEGDEDEQMEVDDKEAESVAGDSAEKRPPTTSDAGISKDHDGAEQEPADETITGEDKEDDEDDAFRVAWEMLELAKATFQKAENKKRLADTLMKLGDVGIETGDPEAIAEMVEGLKIRKEVFPANHRIIPETHFKIGVAFAYFEKYDEAIQHFTSAKDCLEKRIAELSKSESKEDKEEVEEMKSILPEIQEKIQDTQESKLDKEKIKGTIGESSKEAAPAPFSADSKDKPASNISHLVKRKRKVDEILPERAAKQSRQEGDADVASTTKTEEPEGTKKCEETAEPTGDETSAPEQAQEKEVVETEEKAETESVENSEVKSGENLETKPDGKSEEVKEVPPSDAEKSKGAQEVKPAEVEAKTDEPEKMEE